MNRERLKQTSHNLAKVIRVLFWLQLIEIVIAAFFVSWHEFFPNEFIRKLISNELLLGICVSLGTGGFVLGILSKFRKLCRSLSLNGDPFDKNIAVIVKSISITVLAAAFVIPALEKTFVKVIHPSVLNTNIALLSVLMVLLAALLFFLSVLIKSGAEQMSHRLPADTPKNKLTS